MMVVSSAVAERVTSNALTRDPGGVYRTLRSWRARPGYRRVAWNGDLALNVAMVLDGFRPAFMIELLDASEPRSKEGRQHDAFVLGRVVPLLKTAPGLRVLQSGDYVWIVDARELGRVTSLLRSGGSVATGRALGYPTPVDLDAVRMDPRRRVVDINIDGVGVVMSNIVVGAVATKKVESYFRRLKRYAARLGESLSLRSRPFPHPGLL